MSRLIVLVRSLCLASWLAACSTGPVPAPVTPTPSPPTPATVTLAPTDEPTPTGESGFPRLALGAQKAGTYQLMAKDPQIRLTLADGWSVYFDESGGTYMTLGDGEFLVGRNEQIIDPETNTPAPIPEDLMGWLADHPFLNASKPKTIEISGMDAMDVFYDPLGNFHVGPGPVARFYAVPLEGPDLFIAVLRSPSGNLDDALAVGVPVVESLEIVTPS